MKKSVAGALVLSALLLGFCAALLWMETIPRDQFSVYGIQELPQGFAPAPTLYLMEGDGRIDLNKATVEELTDLPGIGPVLANRILAYRAYSGGFSAPEELLGVEGIGEKTLQNILPYVFCSEIEADTPAKEDMI